MHLNTGLKRHCMNCVYDLISRMEVEGRPVGCPDGGFPFDLGNGVNFNLVKEFAFFLDNEVALHVGNLHTEI